MTKAALEALVNALLAPAQPITANGQHKPSMQKLMDEMYDAQSRGNVLAGVGNTVSLSSGDKVIIIRSGQAYLADKSLFGASIGYASQSTGTLNFLSLQRFVFAITGIGAPLTFSHVADANLLKVDFSFDITDLAGVLTFPSNYRMMTGDGRWDSGDFSFTATEIGVYKGVATKSGSAWLLSISKYPFGDSLADGIFDESFDDTFE